MKITCFVLMTIALLSSKLLAEDAPSIPSFDQVTEISLSTYNWDAHFNPDGSGGLSYGSLPGDHASARPKSFILQEVYNLLVPHLRKERSSPKEAAVFLHVKGLPPGTPTNALYLGDKETIKKLMSDALAKSAPWEPDRFKELLAKFPLLQDGPRSPKSLPDSPAN